MAVLLRQLASQASSLRLIGASTIALAAALVANPAQAQNALQGNPTVESGSVTFGGTVGQDTITVASNQAVINWAPNDTSVGGPPIDFLPVGNLALFVNDATLANDFTVLNRILPLDPTRAVALNGTIQSRFEDMVSGALTPGGGVWFYSPGGIVVGGTAVIDVGRLALTTADPVRDTGGNFIMSGQTVFQPAVSGTGVIVNPGASITASPQNSYVAMVAPYVRQNGSVNVNGSAAYVGAEGATITISNGLFDIQVTQGTDGDAGNVAVNHSGTTTGPASSGAGDNHRVYAVAIPKNTAVTMAITNGSTLGFDVAGAADVVGNAVILSAGYNVSGSVISGQPTPGIAASIVSEGASYTSTLVARAVTNTFMLAGLGNANFAGGLNIRAGVDAQVASRNGNTLTITGNATISADANSSAPDGANQTAGNASFYTEAGSTISVTGNLLVTANANGNDNISGAGTGGIGQGGNAAVAANDGTLSVGGSTLVRAQGFGGAGSGGSGGGAGRGGTARISSAGTGLASLTFAQSASIIAGGAGGVGSPVAVGGAGTGGTAQIAVGPGLMTLTGGAAISATGTGASAVLTGSGGGAGTGGTANLVQEVGGVAVIGSDVFVRADGAGGRTLIPGNAGAGQGGAARIISRSATLDINGNVELTATGTGGDGGDLSSPGNGGAGRGGTAELRGEGGNIDVSGTASLVSAGFGGSAQLAGTGGLAVGGTSSVGLVSGAGTSITIGGTVLADAAGIGGDGRGTGSGGGGATGGNATLFATVGSINAGPDVTLTSLAIGGAGIVGANGGNATGGTANLSVGTGSITLTGLTSVSTDATGGQGQTVTQATGGQAVIAANAAGSITLATANISSQATGGAAPQSGGLGGNALGGDARMVATNGGAITVNGNFSTVSTGRASNGVFGTDGGNGTGGTASISQGSGGTIAINGNAIVRADGTGSASLGGGNGIGGNGRGGDTRIAVNDSTITITGTATVSASGTGGNGGSLIAGIAGSGGTGTGGLANLGAAIGVLRVDGASDVSALGTGGASLFAGNGGAATGGQALVGIVSGAAAEIRLGGANNNSATAQGGDGRGNGNSGGAATGGTAQVFATTGAVRLNGTSSNSDAAGLGGAGALGANAGAATGGITQYNAAGGLLAAAGSISAASNATSGAVTDAGNGAIATGGTALIGGGNMAGTITVGGSAAASASAFGGALNGGTAGTATAGLSGYQVTQNGRIAVTGTASALSFAQGSANTGGSGGNAQGGTAVMVITGGTGTAAINVGGNALIDARAVGGVGQGTNVNGGNATGGNARVNAFDGDMTFTSGLDVRAAGLGGSVGGGGSGNGGNGVGGNATVAARNGDIAVTGLTNTGIAALPQVSIFAFSGASGGNGAGGGNGGNATGGTQTVPNTEGGAQIVALNGATSASSITAASAWTNASAGGGLGGAGAVGGAGGNATGGTTLLLGSAGNGQINFGLSVASTPGNGGRGGDGTTQGGAGGNAIGGFDQMGTQSGINNTASNTGSASLGTALLFSAATGGTGGNASAGTGGAGGDATGGSGVLLVRGSQVSAAPLTLTATAQGGNGGTGTVAAGAGGDAISSGAGIFASQRFQTTQRGTLTAGATTINAGATAGLGSTNGQAFTRDGSVLSITQADATLASFTLNSAAANEQAAVSTPAEIIVRDGNLTVTNGLLVAHDGDIAVQVSNGALNAGSFSVDGDNFVVSPSLPNPPAPGTITAGTINILSDDALIVQANLAGGTVTVSNLVNGVAPPAPVTLLNVSATDFSVQSRGVFTAGNITASNSGNGVFFGSVDVGDISAPELSIILPAGDISTGAITVTGDLLLETANGNITTGNVTGGSDSDADFDASGNIITGNVTTGDSITAQAGGTIQMGNLSAGIVNPSPAAGAGYGIGVAALGNVALGNLEAGAIAGLASVNGSVSTGTISVGDSVLALVGQDFSTGAITAGNGSTDFVYLADSSMLALGGPIDNFDPTPIFAATPVRSSGAISTGAISGGNVLAAAGTNLATSGAITGSQRVALDAGGSIDLQGNVSAPQIGITASNLNLGANARLGTASTASLRLTANSGTGLLFGGTPTTLAVFQIDGSEAQRLQAQNINVQAGSIEIRDVTLLGSVAANPNLVGGNGRLAISASGNISVTGAFAVDQMANTNEVAINADRLAVVTDQGSIILSGNSPGGTLSLRANDIHVARQNILTQLASNVNFAGRDAALAQGTGAGTPSLQAHQINLSARNSLLIQNNGSASEFAGFTAYNDGVNVINIGFSPTNPAASTRLDMVIYGNLIDIDTGLVTADGSIRDTIIDRLRVGEFSLTSSINGCLLSADACFASHDDGSGNILSGIEDRQESEDEEEKERDEEEEVILAKAASSSPIQPPVTIIDSRPMIQQPLLDDPITGGGNPAQVRPNPTNSSGE